LRGDAVLAIVHGMPGESVLPVWIVNDCAPRPTVSDVVEVPFDPGPDTAVDADTAAAAAAALASATWAAAAETFVEVSTMVSLTMGSKLVLKPPACISFGVDPSSE
jgi:hypothetical protein